MTASMESSRTHMEKKLFGMSNTHRNFSKKLEKVGEIEDFLKAVPERTASPGLRDLPPICYRGGAALFECFHGLAG